MTNFVKRLKRFKRIRNILIIFSALFVFVYIGAEPYLQQAFITTAPIQIILFVLVGIALTFLFIYESKYAKAEAFFYDAEYEINDAGYYYTKRSENDVISFVDSVKNDLIGMGYKCNNDCNINDLSFDIISYKGSEFLYAVALTDIERSDVIAYLDSALYDITNNKLRSKGNALVVFVCNTADESATALSKTVSKTFNGKHVLNMGIAIAELESKRVYFRGNEPSVIQKLACEFVLNCELPIDKELIGSDKLESQLKLMETLNGFDFNDFKNGKYYER